MTKYCENQDCAAHGCLAFGILGKQYSQNQVGYLPQQETQDQGGYEPWVTSLRRLRDALAKLHPQCTYPPYLERLAILDAMINNLSE